MKFILSPFLMAGTLFFAACNNDNKTAQSTEGASDSSQTAPAGNTTQPATETATATSAPFKEVLAHYLHVKNALANDNSAEAAAGAKAMTEAIAKVDQSAFTADQKKQYADVAEDLKEHAEHTATNAGKIDHQREHFVGMSEDVADLVQTFGASQTLYVDHCPMANENKGANWISETEEIRNPYMGKKMPKCGTVEKVIKQ